MIKMNNKFKIILNYIKDLSVEIPDPEALLVSRENIKKYSLEINITSNHLKNKMIEVITKLNYKDPTNNKKKSNFEIQYSTVVQILDEKINKDELKKMILCDIQIEIYPKLEEIFLNILKNSGFPNINFEKKIDFEKLYKEKNN
tara:strand:- start:20 stop:451 length:432 start_codon:yes stop_codon:yes gene_type:complete